MGYAIATPMMSQKAKAHMMTFWAKHFRPAHVIAPDHVREDYDSSCDGPSDDMIYDNGPSKIGFEYGAGSGDCCRHYMQCILTWMALRAGRTRRFQKLSKEISCPYYVYDGYQAIPVVDVEVWKPRLEQGASFNTGARGADPKPTLLKVGVFNITQGKRIIGVASVDSTGYRPYFLAHRPLWAEEFALFEPLVKTELVRLTEIWNGE